MKKYEKPQIIKNEFVADESVAACGDTALSYEQQTVNCIIDGSTTIFTDLCGNYAIDQSKLVDYNGTTYYVWYDGNTSTTNSKNKGNNGNNNPSGNTGGGSTVDDTLLRAIQQAGGIDQEPGWHAATFSSITTTVSSS